jgi:hypothetical protein
MIDPNEPAQSSVSRRDFLTGGLALAAAITYPPPARRKAFLQVLPSRSLLTTTEKESAQ